MAAYPFTQAISWADLVEQMGKIGVKLVRRDITHRSGEIVKAAYFEHRMDGMVFRAEIDPELDNSEFVMPTTIRSICNQLRIHPRCFGLDLG